MVIEIGQAWTRSNACHRLRPLVRLGGHQRLEYAHMEFAAHKAKPAYDFVALETLGGHQPCVRELIRDVKQDGAVLRQYPPIVDAEGWDLSHGVYRQIAGAVGQLLGSNIYRPQGESILGTGIVDCNTPGEGAGERRKEKVHSSLSLFGDDAHEWSA